MEMSVKKTDEYRQMPLQDVMSSLTCSLDGLSEAEAAERIRRCGPNEVREVKKNPILRFLKRYWGPMPWLLEFAMVLTFILRHYTEGVIIFVLLTVNAVIGFAQSQSSQKAIELLKSKLQIKVKVLRGGNWVLKDAKDLVPGDVLTLKLGDLVPADVYVVSGETSVDTSSLTGESLPGSAKAGDVIFSGSIIKRGETECIAVNTGLNTYFGKTVSLVQIARPKSKQQELMFSIVKYMMILGIAASAVVSCYAVYLHKDVLSILSFIAVFLIGAIPVALPAVLTIVQAVGALDLSKKGVLVTRLDSIEDASSIDVFCFDKTGTITQNRLTVTDCKAFGTFRPADAVNFAALASNEKGMDTIDSAILEYAKSSGSFPSDGKQLAYTPFSPANKRTEATVQTGGKEYRVMKGSPQIILQLCDPQDRQSAEALEQAVQDYSLKGERSIAIAVSDGGAFRLAGLLGLSDPPRKGSGEMIRKIKELGIRIFMLTGDGQAIAREISGQVGIGSRIGRAGDLERLNGAQRAELLRSSDGFAEVYPEDKFKIVQALQEEGHMVGMTGDGVNDSPALKQAELGTAVSDATDVAKASASVVLTKPGLGGIIDAIQVSRQTYQRMLTWVINKVTKVVEVVVLFTIGFFWQKNMLISLLGMSLLVFANDFVTMLIATDNVKSTQSPNQWKMKNIVSASLFLGIVFALEDLLMVFLGLSVFHLPYEQLCTLVMLSLVFNTQFRILIVRERRHFWSSMPSLKLLFANLLTIVGFATIGFCGGIVPPLAFYQVMALLGLETLFMPVIDFIKYGLFRAFHIS